MGKGPKQQYGETAQTQGEELALKHLSGCPFPGATCPAPPLPLRGPGQMCAVAFSSLWMAWLFTAMLFFGGDFAW